eukprot:scaffold160387_cov38-Attheya_sp.AAC.1
MTANYHIVALGSSMSVIELFKASASTTVLIVNDSFRLLSRIVHTFLGLKKLSAYVRLYEGSR